MFKWLCLRHRDVSYVDCLVGEELQLSEGKERRVQNRNGRPSTISAPERFEVGTERQDVLDIFPNVLFDMKDVQCERNEPPSMMF